MFFSIIVPIYNVDGFLKNTLESIKNNSFDDYEVLLIDDGSDDNSREICSKYVSEYKNWKYFYKENGGLSDARNYGMVRAKGKYVIFVDGDDTISPDTFSTFYHYIQDEETELDIVTGNARKIEVSGSYEYKISSDVNKIYSGENYFVNEMRSRTLLMAVWIRIYRREFLMSNNLFFKKGLLHEDEDFSPRTILKAKNVLVTDFTFYNYLIRENSITTKKDRTDNGKHLIETMGRIDEYLSKNHNENIHRVADNHIISQYLRAYCMINIEGYKLNNSIFNNRKLDFKIKIKVLLYKVNKSFFKKVMNNR